VIETLIQEITKKSDLLDIDLNEELAAIRAQKTGKDVLRKKKLKAPSDVATIRHRLGLTQKASAVIPSLEFSRC
jgi:hypothetical protein